MGSTLKVDNIVGTSGTSAPITLSGDTATLGTGTTLGSGADIKAAINASGTAPIYACRAWVNFDGTDTSSANPLSFTNTNATNHGDANSAGETLCAIRNSGNVSKIVRNGTGDYTITFTTEMPHANYSTTQMCGNDSDSATSHTMIFGANSARTTSSVRVRGVSITASSGNTADKSIINIAIFC